MTFGSSSDVSGLCLFLSYIISCMLIISTDTWNCLWSNLSFPFFTFNRTPVMLVAKSSPRIWKFNSVR